jgi:hypothetical protein
LPGEEGADRPQPSQVNPLSLALKVFGGSLAVINTGAKNSGKESWQMAIKKSSGGKKDG